MEEKKAKKKISRLLSLRVKSVLIIVLVAIILSVTAIVISYRVYSSAMDEHYKILTSNLAKTAASQLDADALMRYYDEVKQMGEFDLDKYSNDEAYRAEYDAGADALKDDQYNEMLNTLFEIKESNDIKYLYVQKLNGDYVTYLMDTDESEDYCQLGVTHRASSETDSMENREYGVPAFITNDEYGWLCTSMEPVMDKAGKPVALVGVDVSMDDIMQDRHDYLRNIIMIIGINIIWISVLTVIVLQLALVNPINKLSEATMNFVNDQDETHEGSSQISKLNIRTGDEIEALSDSIKQMEQDIYSYINHLTEVTAEKERIGAELDVATHIQSSMLPNIFPNFGDKPEFEIYATMNPAKEVGGDFFDFFMVDERHLAIVMADVSGKGVPAALFMVIGKTLIKDHTLPDTDLGTVFSEVNNLLCESNSEGLFITAFEGVLDLVTGEFRFVNAGHEMPFIYHKGGVFAPYKIKAAFVLAGMEDMRYKSGELTLEPGDKIFQYTDGVTEATDANGGLYGMERLEICLNKVAGEKPNVILPAVKEDIDAFVGDEPQFDDITMLCLEYKQRMQIS